MRYFSSFFLFFLDDRRSQYLRLCVVDWEMKWLWPEEILAQYVPVCTADNHTITVTRAGVLA